MKTISLLVFYILFFFLLSEGVFSQTTFQRTYGGSIDDGYVANAYPEAVRQTSDGGYIMAGSSRSFGQPSFSIDGYLVRIDANGYPVWSKNYGASWNDYALDVKPTSDGGYIFAGWTDGLGASPEPNALLWLVKTNSSGTQSWSKTYGGTAGLSYGRKVQQTSDGGYIVVGQTMSFGAGSRDVYLVKTNATGTLSWAKTYGTALDDMGYDVVQTNDGGFAIAGQTKATADMCLIKTDSDGAQQWAATYGTIAGTEIAYSIKQTNDGGYILSGYYYGAQFHLSMVKTTSDGTLSWSKDYGGTNNIGYESQPTSDGGYILTGYGVTAGSATNDGNLIKTNSAGNILWTRTFGGSLTEHCYAVQQTSDEGYVLAGYTRSFGAGTYDYYLIKTNSDGNSGCNELSPSFTENNTGVLMEAISFTESFGGTEGSGGIELTPATVAMNACSNTILPVTLLSFHGYNNGEVNVLHWETAAEINNDYFSVERSSDGVQWNAIGIVKGAGNSDLIQRYGFIDRPENPIPKTEMVYYRLKQVDYDGHQAYYGPVAVRLSVAGEWDLILENNPANEELMATLFVPEESALTLCLTDLQGRTLKQEKWTAIKGSSFLKIDLYSVKAGIYFIKVYDEKNLVCKTFIKM